LDSTREDTQKAATLPLVMHVITDLGPGGAENVLLGLVAASRKFRHVVVSLAREGKLATPLRAAGAAVFALGMRRTMPSPGAIVRLARLIQREQPAVLQTWLYHADLIGMLAARLTHFRPVAWNLRCSNMDLSRYRWSTRAVVNLLTRLSPWPDLVMVNSEAGRHWHSEIGYHPRRWEIVPNGIDTAVFRPDAASRAQWRSRLAVRDGNILVGMVARRDPMKDHETMLAAAVQAARKVGGLAFVLAGNGVVRTDRALARLADAVAAPVHLLGECDDMPALTAAFDIAALSSAFGEGFPNVVAEAMATGVPCVVTNVGDAAAIVGDTRLVVPPRDPTAMANALAALAADATKRHELGAAARRRIVALYGMPAMVARYEAVWRTLIEA